MFFDINHSDWILVYEDDAQAIMRGNTSTHTHTHTHTHTQTHTHKIHDNFNVNNKLFFLCCHIRDDIIFWTSCNRSWFLVAWRQHKDTACPSLKWRCARSPHSPPPPPPPEPTNLQSCTANTTCSGRCNPTGKTQTRGYCSGGWAVRPLIRGEGGSITD